MASKFSNSAAVLALGMAFFVAPALLGTASPFAIDSAFAAKGGNGNGNSGGNGNGNGNGVQANLPATMETAATRLPKLKKQPKSTVVPLLHSSVP